MVSNFTGSTPKVNWEFSAGTSSSSVEAPEAKRTRTTEPVKSGLHEVQSGLSRKKNGAFRANAWMDAFYHIPIQEVLKSPELTQKIGQLRVQRTGSGRFAKKPLELCQKTMTHYKVPKFWGLEHFGPCLDRSCEGAPMREGVKFTGKLLNTVGEPQVEIVRRLVAHLSDAHAMPGCTWVSPCGTGKTVNMLAASTAYGRRTAVLLPRIDLIEQTAERIKTFVPGARIGYIWANKREVYDCDFVLVSLQTVITDSFADEVRKNVGGIREMIMTIGVLWVDELHHMAADVFVRAFGHFPVRRVVGQTATFRRKDGAAVALEWVMGPLLFQVHRSHEDLTVWKLYSRLPAKDAFLEGGEIDLATMHTEIACSSERTVVLGALICHLLLNERTPPEWARMFPPTKLLDGKSPKRTILVLVQRRFHADLLLALVAEMLQLKRTSNKHFSRADAADGSIGLVSFKGGASKGAKTEMKELLKTAKVIFATSHIAREGLDMAWIDTVLFAGAESDIEQPVGRAERYHAHKNYKLAIDLIDAESEFFLGMARGRQRFYDTGGCQQVSKNLDPPVTEDWFRRWTERADALLLSADKSELAELVPSKRAQKRKRGPDSDESDSSSSSTDVDDAETRPPQKR